MCSAINPSDKPGADISSAPLNAERIVDEAIALMQEQGLDAVSLRRLAGRLGVQAMSIYWHIPNKEELLRRMSKQLYAEATKDMPAAQTWQDWAYHYGKALWIMYHGARDAARLTFSLGYGVEEIRGFRRQLADILEPLGLTAAEAAQLHASIHAMVIGWTGFDKCYGEAIGQLEPIEPAMTESVNTLIAGFECRRQK